MPFSRQKESVRSTYSSTLSRHTSLSAPPSERSAAEKPKQRAGGMYCIVRARSSSLTAAADTPTGVTGRARFCNGSRQLIMNAGLRLERFVFTFASTPKFASPGIKITRQIPLSLAHEVSQNSINNK
ncbi:hypothetical protein B566_EDAN002931 [Ephemera danica]|nr:hypothetical protein B566_EDAN002931 [Ephemera danica]